MLPKFVQLFVQAMSGTGTWFALYFYLRETQHRFGAMKSGCPAYQAAACRNRGLGFCPDHHPFWLYPSLYFLLPDYAILRSVFAACSHTYAPLRKENKSDCQAVNTHQSQLAQIERRELLFFAQQCLLVSIAMWPRIYFPKVDTGFKLAAAMDSQI